MSNWIDFFCKLAGVSFAQKALESENREINTPFCFTISIEQIITYVCRVVNSTDGFWK